MKSKSVLRYRNHFMVLLVCLLVAGNHRFMDTTTVHIRFIDAETGDTTAAMACITSSDGEVRLPPDGRILQEPSTVDDFYRGITFKADNNWIGPARKMRGIGDNKDRSYVYKLMPSIPYWHEPVMYQTSGDFTIKLPDGHWRIAVDHGMEYQPAVREINVDGQTELDVVIRLQRWINMPEKGWWSGDVHVHHPTADAGHREFLMQYAEAVDLHVVNVLAMGHHKGVDFPQQGFGKSFRFRRGNTSLVSGQEDPRSTFGHIIGLNLQSMVRDTTIYDFYDTAFRGIHRQEGALVGFAHFSWNGCDLPRGFPWYVTTEQLDFIELLQFAQINTLGYYDYLNLGLKLTAAAGSDIPWGSTMGEVRTYVYTGSEFDPDKWFAGLKDGHTFVSNGPILDFSVDEKLPGSEIQKSKGDKIRIKAGVMSHPTIGLPETLLLISNDGVVKAVSNSENDTSLHFELEQTISQSQWFVLSSKCQNNALAHTSPVYVIVDGKPAWSSKRGPNVIQRQLKAIDEIAREFSDTQGLRAQGIMDRLTKARTYYTRLLKQMTESHTL